MASDVRRWFLIIWLRPRLKYIAVKSSIRDCVTAQQYYLNVIGRFDRFLCFESFGRWHPGTLFSFIADDGSAFSMRGTDVILIKELRFSAKLDGGNKAGLPSLQSTFQLTRVKETMRNGFRSTSRLNQAERMTVIKLGKDGSQFRTGYKCRLVALPPIRQTGNSRQQYLQAA